MATLTAIDILVPGRAGSLTYNPVAAERHAARTPQCGTRRPKLFKRFFGITCVSAVSLIFAAGPASAGQIVPDFSGVTLGTPAPLSVNQDGITITYTSPDGNPPVDGGFSVESTFFKSINGNVLLDFGMHFYTLDILFSSPITDFATSFAVDDPSLSTPDPTMFATAYLTEDGTETAVGSTSSLGAIPDGFPFPEGVLSYSNAGGFDELVITSNIGDYAIGRDTAGTGGGPGGPASAPEPFSWAMAGGGLALAAARKRFFANR